MGAVAISDIRTVPVQEDLTTEDLGLEILRGFESMKRVDKKYRTGVSLVKGEWGVLNDDDTLTRPGASAVRNTYLVFAGTDRFDAAATGQVSLVMNSPVMVKTNQFNDLVTYHVGDLLTVKSLGTGKAYVTKASTGEVALARVSALGSGFLIYETMLGDSVAP